MDFSECEAFLAKIFQTEELILITMSSPRSKADKSKVTIRPVMIKGNLIYQIAEHRDKQIFHHNLSIEDAEKWFKQHISDFKQTFLYTSESDYHLLFGKKGHITLLKKPATKVPREMTHNRKKEYLIPEGTPIPFLVQLGLMSPEGKIYAAKRDKFKQTNRFLELVEDVLPSLNPHQQLKIVDFGCGKAYLTFALYHFLKITKGYSVKMIGLDLKTEIIQSCQELARSLGYEQDLEFVREDINKFELQGEVDLVVALHACDTATDAAIEKAIQWHSKIILCVPCCQHELMHQIQDDSLDPLLKHGILRERFASLVTDAARVQLLEVLGYRAQILEFVDLEHTAKNLLIRAVKHAQIDKRQKSAWAEYLKFKQHLKIHPSLEKRFHARLKEIE